MPGHGTFYWNEYITHDVASTCAFYSATCGWTYETAPMPEGDYTLIKQGDAVIGGISPATPEMGDAPEHWLTYIAVDDARAAAETVTSQGGQVLNGPFTVPEVGDIVIAMNAAGGVVGFIQPPETPA